MNSQRIAALLDESCADALNEWWDTHNRILLQNRASLAIQDLKRKLRSFEKPNYDDDYILSAYVIVHQISHINMALQAFSSLQQERGLVSYRSDSLRIVDLGAGTSAGRIGAVLMAAEAIRNGHYIEHIYFDEIDISEPMLEMGELVWQAFTERVRNEWNDPNLRRAVEVLDYNQFVDWREVGEQSNCETWLTAFHVVYQDQVKNSLQEVLKGLYERVDPIAGSFSCYHSTDWFDGAKNLDLMQSVMPPFDMSSQCSPSSSGEKCPTSKTSQWAADKGFISHGEFNYGWRPFLKVRDCTLLYGYNIPF